MGHDAYSLNSDWPSVMAVARGVNVWSERAAHQSLWTRFGLSPPPPRPMHVKAISPRCSSRVMFQEHPDVLLFVPRTGWEGYDLDCSIFRRARAHGRRLRCRGRNADCVRGVCGPLPHCGPVLCPTPAQDASDRALWGAPKGLSMCFSARNTFSQAPAP